jgi:mannose-6-phosphate isomerase-like protein (cupin superfamily)
MSDPRKRLAIFRAKEATPLGPELMQAPAMDDTRRARLAKLAESGVRPGLGEQSLVLFREAGEAGMSLVHLWLKSGYPLPPHSHDVDCLYYVVAGELRIGDEVLAKGDGMFVPAGTGYTYEAGPEGVEVLEFRNATRFGITLKGSDKQWDRVGELFRERTAIWETEQIPPSKRSS